MSRSRCWSWPAGLLALAWLRCCSWCPGSCSAGLAAPRWSKQLAPAERAQSVAAQLRCERLAARAGALWRTWPRPGGWGRAGAPGPAQPRERLRATRWRPNAPPWPRPTRTAAAPSRSWSTSTPAWGSSSRCTSRRRGAGRAPSRAVALDPQGARQRGAGLSWPGSEASTARCWTRPPPCWPT